MGLEELLSYEKFADRIICEMQKYLVKGEKLLKDSVIKNNDTIKKRIVVQRDEKGIYPIIYPEDFYEEYKSGKKIEDIMDIIISIINNNSAYQADNKYCLDFESVKDNIIFTVVSFNKNSRLLLELPHDRISDLAVIYRYLVFNNEENIGTVRISNELLHEWNVSKEDIRKLAYQNTIRLLPYNISRMNMVIEKMIEGSIAKTNENYYDEAEKMYVLTNNKGINGAACMLYEGVLDDFYNKCKSDFIIIPSSIHELILLSDINELSFDEMSQTVKIINKDKVSKEEVLSDHVYSYYDLRSEIKNFINMCR